MYNLIITSQGKIWKPCTEGCPLSTSSDCPYLLVSYDGPERAVRFTEGYPLLTGNKHTAHVCFCNDGKETTLFNLSKGVLYQHLTLWHSNPQKNGMLWSTWRKKYRKNIDCNILKYYPNLKQLIEENCLTFTLIIIVVSFEIRASQLPSDYV